MRFEMFNFATGTFLVCALWMGSLRRGSSLRPVVGLGAVASAAIALWAAFA